MVALLQHIFAILAHVPKLLFWQFSLLITKNPIVWYVYQKTAGPDGWFWGRYLLTTLWILYMSYAVFKMMPVINQGLSFWLTTWLVVLFGILVLVGPAILYWRVKRSKDRILNLMHDLENARR